MGSDLQGRASLLLVAVLLLALGCWSTDAWSWPFSARHEQQPSAQGDLILPRKDPPASAKKLQIPTMPVNRKPTVPAHPHPNVRRPQQSPRRVPPKAAPAAAKPSPAATYVCKSKTAQDLLARAMERIAGSLFLTQERLDHFMGEDRFDKSFASKYIYQNWQNYTAARGTEVYDRCAVVGNSGHLTLSQYGRIIDSFDAVIRTNQAPTQGYTKLVGRKTTFRLINRAMSRRYQEAMDSRYRRLKDAKAGIDTAIKAVEEKAERANKGRKPGTAREPRPARLGATLSKLARSSALKRLGVTEEMLSKVATDKFVVDRLRTIMAGVGTNDVKVNREFFPMETNVTVVLVTEATSARAEMESFIRSTRQLRPDVRVVVQSGKARKVVEEMLSVWTKRLMACWGIDTSGAGGSRATTGILATVVMLKQCKSVTLYGFGPPQKGPGAAPFHFYDGLMHRTYQSASKDVHNFSAELRFLMKLRDEAIIQICNEDSHRLCGYTAKQMQEMQQGSRDPAAEDKDAVVVEDEHDVGGSDEMSAAREDKAQQEEASEATEAQLPEDM